MYLSRRIYIYLMNLTCNCSRSASDMNIAWSLHMFLMAGAFHTARIPIRSPASSG